MDPSEIAAVLSALMHDEQNKDNQQPIKNDQLRQAFSLIMEEAKKVFVIY